MQMRVGFPPSFFLQISILSVLLSTSTHIKADQICPSIFILIIDLDFIVPQREKHFHSTIHQTTDSTHTIMTNNDRLQYARMLLLLFNAVMAMGIKRFPK